jgi:nucleotidyltransferase/DNA polymerase involved in DNA repair
MHVGIRQKPLARRSLSCYAHAALIGWGLGWRSIRRCDTGARSLKAEIRAETGLVALVGLSTCRLVSKIASDQKYSLSCALLAIVKATWQAVLLSQLRRE